MNRIKSAICVLLSVFTCTMFMCSCEKGGSSSDTDESSKKSSETTSQVTVTTQSESSLADSGGTEKEPADITPAMWEVTDKNGTKMTIMGSMHALTENDYPLPEAVTEAYNKADILAVECDPSDTSLNQKAAIYNNMYLEEGKTIKDVLSEKGYNSLANEAALLEIDMKLIEKMKPWAAQNVIDGLLVQKAGLDSNKGIDTYFLGQAKNTKKEIYQVESAEFQTNLLMNTSDTVYEIQFLSAGSAKNSEELTKNTKDTYECWRSGDTEKMQKLLEGEEDVKALNLSDSQMKALEEYNDDMLYNRNKNMEKAIKELLSQKKNVFYVVGLAHFLGEGGILDLLEKDGYTVTRIKY